MAAQRLDPRSQRFKSQTDLIQEDGAVRYRHVASRHALVVPVVSRGTGQTAVLEVCLAESFIVHVVRGLRAGLGQRGVGVGDEDDGQDADGQEGDAEDGHADVADGLGVHVGGGSPGRPRMGWALVLLNHCGRVFFFLYLPGEVWKGV